MGLAWVVVIIIVIIATVIILRVIMNTYYNASIRQLYTTNKIDPVADIVIIGGGTAGCVVARRLTDKYPHKSIIVVERGQDLRHDRSVYRAENSLNIAYTAPYSQVIVTDYPGVSSTVGAIYGGCSSHNYGLVVQGTKERYRRTWLSKLRMDEDELDKYINKVYSKINVFFLPPSINPIKYVVPMVGITIRNGLIPVKEALDVFINHGPLRADKGLTQNMMDAMEYSTFPKNRKDSENSKVCGKSNIKIEDNYNANGVVNCVCPTQQLYVDPIQGVRASINRQYLPDGYTPKNLTLIAGAEVDTIDPSTLSVTTTDGRVIRSREKMVLCAGGILSPYLLLKSKVKIPGIGKGLVNHYGTQAVFAIKGIKDFSSGPLAFLPYDSSHRDICDKDDTYGNYDFERERKWQILTSGSALTNIDFLKKQGVDTNALQAEGYIFVTYLIYLMDPQTRGEIVVSADGSPKVNLNLFKNKEDCQSLIDGMKYLGRNYNHLRSKYDIKAIFPPENVYRENDNIILDYVKKGVGIADHYSCTMSGVVDSNLALKGYPNFHVVDASVFPAISDGNTEFPAIMIGEIGADKIIRSMCNNESSC